VSVLGWFLSTGW